MGIKFKIPTQFQCVYSNTNIFLINPNLRDLKAIKEQVVVTLESNKSLVIDLHNRDQLNTDKIVKQNEHIE